VIGEYHEFIDLSHHNTVRSYDALDPRFEAIIVRVSDGAMADRRFDKHFDGAIDTKRKVGVYHRISPYVEAKRQLIAFGSGLALLGYGDQGDILPVLDLEDNIKPTPEQRAAFDAKMYADTVNMMAEWCNKRFGGCILYVSRVFAARLGKKDFGNYPIWGAWYPRKESVSPGWMSAERLEKLKVNPNLLDGWRAWQYGQQRMPSFAAGPIDVNVVDSWEGLTL